MPNDFADEITPKKQSFHRLADYFKRDDDAWSHTASALSERVFREIMDSEYRAQLEAIFDYAECEVEPSFMGFLSQYEALSRIIPYGRTVYDFGCCNAIQGWFFRKHKAYVGVDPLIGKSPVLHIPQGQYFPQTAGEFLESNQLDQRSFAISNYVCFGYGEDVGELMRQRFTDLFIFYPKNGDWRAERQMREDSK